MQKISEKTSVNLRLIVPPTLKKEGTILQEVWGNNHVVLAENLDLFYEFISTGAANIWMADASFLTMIHEENEKTLKSFPLLYIRTVETFIPSHILNAWHPAAFLDRPLDTSFVESVKEKLENALYVNEQLRLVKAFQNNLKENDSQHVVLEMDHAFDKEINLIRNDIYYQQLDSSVSKDRKVRLDMFYKPMEILSGDSYSVRKINDNTLFCFIIDAMSKGVSAALTSTSSTSILNFLVDEMIEKGTFDLRTLIEQYVKFTKKELLDEEIISCFFVAFDKNALAMEYALFGMPPFIACHDHNKVELIKSNNMPLSLYTDTFKVTTKPMDKFHKILMYSDGLCESEMEDGSLYRNALTDDFIHSANIASFIETMKSRIGQGNDDIAFFYLQGVDATQGDVHRFELKSTRESIDEGLYEVSPLLEKYGASPKVIAETTLTLSELLTNALEHGNFSIDKREKNRLIDSDTFDTVLEAKEMELAALPIHLHVRVYEHQNKLLFEAMVRDVGKGFDTGLLKNLIINQDNFNGRGFMIIKKLVDRFYFNEKGNEITILKFLD